MVCESKPNYIESRSSLYLGKDLSPKLLTLIFNCTHMVTLGKHNKEKKYKKITKWKKYKRHCLSYPCSVADDLSYSVADNCPGYELSGYQNFRIKPEVNKTGHQS